MSSKTPAAKSGKSKNEPLKELEFASTVELKSARILLRPSKRKTVKKIKVVLEGTLNINNSKSFIEEIEKVLENYDYINFHLDKPDTLDLSFIQSLYYLKTYHANHNKNVAIDSDLTGDVKKMVVNAGFESLLFVPKLV